jgi:hypothetical protein
MRPSRSSAETANAQNIGSWMNSTPRGLAPPGQRRCSDHPARHQETPSAGHDLQVGRFPTRSLEFIIQHENRRYLEYT